MKKLNAILFIIASAAFMCGCKKGIFSKDGEIKVQERNVGTFNKISLYNKINLILTQSTEDKIKVEAGENVLSSITTEVTDGNLSIKNRDSSLINKPNQVINVYASVKNLNGLVYEGAGSITSTNTIQTGYFLLYSKNGAGDVRLSMNAYFTTIGIYNENADFILDGQSDGAYAYCSSRGTLDLRNYSIKKLEIDYSGVRDAHINVTESLKGRIFYKGNVYYKGNPQLDISERNQGRFIRL